MKRWYPGASALVACTWLLVSARVNPPRVETNSLGMKLVRIEPGTFTMGVDSAPLPAELLEGKAGVKGRGGDLLVSLRPQTVGTHVSSDGTWGWRVWDDVGQMTAESRWRGKDLLSVSKP